MSSTPPEITALKTIIAKLNIYRDILNRHLERSHPEIPSDFRGHGRDNEEVAQPI
jgi:hypothetical protein